MTDFWFNILWTTLVSVTTILADWIAGKFIYMTRGYVAIRKSFEQALTDEEKLMEVQSQLEHLARREASGLAWGADLVVVAVALDLAILGLWTRNHALFPFFQRWNVEAINREAQVWLVLLLIHFVLLLVSLVLKHLHGESVETLKLDSAAPVFRLDWWQKNAWMFGSNVLGFLALLSSFLIISNTI